MRHLLPAAVAAAAAALCSPAAAQTARAQLDGDLPPELGEQLEAAVGVVGEPSRTSLEARRRAREAAEDVVQVLRSRGYYGYEIGVDVRPGPPPMGVVNITPGPLFRLAQPTVTWTAPVPPPQVRDAGAAALGLQAGEPARAADVLAAEGRVVAAVQARGYADARAQPAEAVVDHATSSLRATFRFAAGRLVRLNGVRLTSEGRTRPQWLQRLAPWSPGESYRPELVAELERRLLDTGVYDAVTVSLGPADSVTPEGFRPVVASLSERKARTLELGASYSTEDGAGVDARWTRYNVLGRADTLRAYGRLSRVDSRLGGELTLPHWRRPQHTLRLGAEAYRTQTDAYDEDGVGVHADITRRFGRTSYLTLGAALDYGRTEELHEDGLAPLSRGLVTASLLGAASLDRSDDPLDPRRGWRALARAEPTLIGGDSSLAFARLEGQVSAYQPLGSERTVLAGRLRIGSALGAGLPELPAPRRFYAGGGGSVRGYGYQDVGPRLADNTPRGGTSLLEASFEVRQQLTERWGVVAFMDAGSIGEDAMPAFDDLHVGAGIGVRYDLGFGPIRADIAVPLNKQRSDAHVHVYLSIGQSF